MENTGELPVGLPAGVPLLELRKDLRVGAALAGRTIVDHCVQIRINNFTFFTVTLLGTMLKAPQHVEDRIERLGVVFLLVIFCFIFGWEGRFVVNDWLAIGMFIFEVLVRCKIELTFSHLRSIPLCTSWLHVDRTEQAESQLPAVTFTTGRTRHGIEQIPAFLLGVPAIGTGFAWGCEYTEVFTELRSRGRTAVVLVIVRIRSRPTHVCVKGQFRTIVCRLTCVFQTVGVHRRVARSGLFRIHH